MSETHFLSSLSWNEASLMASRMRDLRVSTIFWCSRARWAAYDQ